MRVLLVEDANDHLKMLVSVGNVSLLSMARSLDVKSASAELAT